MTKFLCGECIHNSDKGGGCLIPKNLGYVDNCNRYLPKDRPVVQTNEEWFCSLSTEEKAEVLFDIWYDGKVLAWDKSKPFYFNRFVTWLKEVHKDEM